MAARRRHRPHRQRRRLAGERGDGTRPRRRARRPATTISSACARTRGCSNSPCRFDARSCSNGSPRRALESMRSPDPCWSGSDWRRRQRRKGAGPSRFWLVPRRRPCYSRDEFHSCRGRRRHGRAPIHLSHAGPDQDLAGRQEGAGEHPSLLLPRRQDRRARRQRLGQVDAAAHHGGHRQGIRRRGLHRRGRPRRLSPAGAAARPRARRARQRDARRRRQAGDPRPLQRTGDELFRRDRGRDDAAAGRDRGAGPVGSRQPGRAGDGRARLPARRFRRRPRSPAASAAASRCASCCWRSRNCCCSTNRPTISTPRRSTGSKAICAPIPARS